MCISEIKNKLKGLNKNIRVLEKDDNNNLFITDLRLENNILGFEQYLNIKISDLNYSEDKLKEICDKTVKLYRIEECHDMGELKAMVYAIVSEFNIDKLVSMPMYQTELEFINSNLNICAYLVD